MSKTNPWVNNNARTRAATNALMETVTVPNIHVKNNVVRKLINAYV